MRAITSGITKRPLMRVKADIQVMREGEARTTAARQIMAKNDIEGCKSHIHSAMEATEK